MLTKIPRWILWGAVILAFCAGYINAVALISFANNAVSHVTGTVTAAAYALVANKLSDFWYSFLIVLAFFCGAVLSGYLVRGEALKAGRSYELAMAVEAFLLLLATILFDRHNYLGEFAASAACGLQNAMIATYSGSVIRTTHLTGIVSDIGAAIGEFLHGARFEASQIKLQSSIFIGFFAGAAVGVECFRRLEYLSFLLPALVILLAAGFYRFKSRQLT